MRKGNNTTRNIDTARASWVVLSLALSGMGLACGGDDIEDIVEGGEEAEVINDVRLTFTDQDSGAEQQFTWVDTDNDGTVDVIDTIQLAPNSTYTLNLAVWNTVATEDENVTEEIQEEAEDHLVVYSVGDDDLLAVAYNDVESSYVDAQSGDDLVVGLEMVVTTGEVGDTTLQVQLLHLPDLKTDSQADNLANGEDDINVTFDVSVQ